MQRSASHSRVNVPRNGPGGKVGPVSGLKGQGLGMGDKTVSLPNLFPNAAISGRVGVGYPPVSSEKQSLKRTPSQLLLERQEFGVLQGAFGSKPKITGFLDLAQFSNHTTSSVPVDQTLFSVSPSVVSFVDFEGLQTYETTITLRNQDSVARRVKVCPPDSPFFEVTPSKSPARLRTQKGGSSTGNSSGDKVAPGMELSYIVRFRPDARIDYAYDLVVVTERETFTVPIRASGGSALLDFPDVVDFGDECIVGHRSERTVLVRNVGDRATKLLCRTSPPFSINVPDGYLEEGAACQVSIYFTPSCAERHECELYLKYGELEAVSTLRGAACNANVSLSHSLLMVDDTYVGLESQGAVTIRNDSDVPVDFSWRLFGSEAEEAEHRLELQSQLREEERDEMLYMQQGSLSEDSDESCSDNERLRARRESKVTKLLGRKYDNIVKATRENPMLFQDAIFSIQPLHGRIWPHSQMTCACCFLPKDALIYTATAYLHAVGQEERAPLEIKGLGIGPKATFSYDELDVGNVFVESAHRYEVQLLNQGDIEVEFRLIKKDTKFAQRFQFTPDHGTIAVGGQREIVVDFKPKELGLFHEVFEWALKGSATAVTLAFRGNSVRPKFDFDIDKINFGTVSFGFLNSRMLTLTNTSEVPCYYTLKVPGDEAPPNNEFVVIPSGGTLLPSCAQRIQVDFTSNQEKKYDAKLSVDLEGVGKELLSIPIIAQCAVPIVSFEPHGVLNYGDISIRYPFHQSLYLHNTSVLPAKFQVEPQEDKSRAEFEPDQWAGTVPPCASHVITVTLTAHTPGPLRIPMYVKIHGRDVPFPLVLVGNSVGPRVVVDPPSLDWSTVQCLEPVTKHVRLTNNSCIDASVRAFMNDRKSLWTVHPKTIHLSPQETLQLALTLKIDETSTSIDYLNLIVNEGEDLTVQVRGKGVGTPVQCAHEGGIESLDFQTLFTTHTESKEIIINNWGRDWRRLTWSKDKEKEKKKEKERKEKEVQEAQSGKKKKQEEAEEIPPVFRVEPENIMLEPKSSYRFTFMAVSPIPGYVEDELICTETHEKGGGAGKVIFRTQLKATFVAPQLTLSRKKIEFEFLWDKAKPIASMSESFTLQNTGPLEVRFTVQGVYPFSTDIEEGVVPPNGTQDVVVDFDPGYKTDRKSGTIKQRMVIQYDDHPATNVVDLIGKVIWPNLELDTAKLDFGTVLNNTSKKLEVKMTNPTVLSVAYRWMFALPGSRQGDEVSLPRTPAAPRTPSVGAGSSVALLHADESSSPSPAASSWGGFSMTPGNTANEAEVELNEVFDILPIFGRIEPGETHTATFTYDGMRDRSFRAIAVCMVDGGPEYEVSLRGTAAPCRYALDRNELDFGDVPFTEVIDAEVYLSNRGQVPANFNFNLSGLSRPYVVDVVPSSGVLKPEERLKVSVRFRAGIPDQVVETVLVEVAHFEPTTLTVRGQGTFPGIVIGLKRMNEEEHHLQLAAAMQRVQQRAIADGDSSGSAVDDKGDVAEGDKLSAIAASPSPSTRPERTRGRSIAGDEDRDPPSPRSVATEGQGSLKDNVSVAARLARLLADPENPDRELVLEVDRHTLCEVLLNGPTKGNTPPSSAGPAGASRTSNMSPSNRRKGKDSNDPPSVTAAHYVCDFGHIALGQEGKKQINIFNCSQEAVSISIDKKNLKDHGFVVSPEKDLKLAPNPDTKNILSVTATRSREEGEASVNYAWNLPVRGGPNYIIQLTANFVLPDLVLSTESIDFGRLIVGQRKRVIIELQNIKSVPVDWAYLEPKDKFGKKPEQAIFDLDPAVGVLQPGERKLVTASFTPAAPGTISGNLSIRMRDNQKRKTISVTGRGEILRLDVRPSLSYQLGPVMPNNGGTSMEFWLMNPTDYPIEVYSADFDTGYLEEERALMDYDGYASGVAEVPIRQPGDGIWKKVARRVLELRKARMETAKAAKEAAAEQSRLDEEARKAAAAEAGEELEAPSEEELADAAAAAEKERLEEEKELAAIAALEEAAADSEEEEEMDASAYPYRVPTKQRVNAILMGPPKAGVSTFAKKLSKDPEDRRRVLKIDDVINWVNQAQKILHNDWTARKIGERLTEGRSPTTSEVAHILQRRSELADCNAGIVLDGLESEHLSPEQVTEAFVEAFSAEKVVLIAVQLPEPEAAEEEEPPEEDPPAATELETVDASADPPVIKPPPPSIAGEAMAAHYETLQSALVTYAEELKTAIIPPLEAAKKAAEDAAVDAAMKAEAAVAAAATAAEQAEAAGLEGAASAPAASGAAVSAGDAPAASATEGEAASEAEPDLETLKTQALAADTEAKKALAEAIAALEDAQAELACCEANVGWKPPEVEIDPALAELLAPPAADPKAKAKAKAKAAAEPPPPEEPVADPAIEELVKVYNQRRAAAIGFLEQYNEKTRLDEEERQRDQERVRRRKKAAALAAKDAQRGRLNPKNSASTEQVDLTASDFIPKMEGWTAPTEIYSIQLAAPPFEDEAVRAIVPLPLIPLEPPLPLPTVTKILNLPMERSERSPLPNFSILTPQPAVCQPIGKVSSRQPSKEQTEVEGEGEDGEEKAESEKETLVSDQARWIIEPQCEQRLLVHFDSEQVATYSTTLSFEVVGDVANGPATISVSGVAALPGISSDPRLIFPRRKKKRPEDGYAVKAFVTSLGVYDFGPLLAGRDPSSRNPAPPPTEEADDLAGGTSGSLAGPAGGTSGGGEEAGVGEGLEGTSQELPDSPEPREKMAISSYVMRHAENIRITNDSLFPANVQLGLSSSGGDFALGEEAVQDSPFIVEPDSLRLEIGESAEVKVWCFPPEKGVYQDTLVARIEHNHEPVAFNLCALGAVPVISIDKEEVDFGRLMMNIRADDQRVRVKNDAAVPVRWQLSCVDSKVVEADPDPDKEPPEEGAPPQLPDEFGVEPKEGLLAAGEERDVRFSFRAPRPAHFKSVMQLDVRDAEGLNGWQEAGKISIASECFAVDCVVEPDPREVALDFGTVLVHTSAERTFEIINRGKFPVRYELAVRRALRELLQIDQPKDELQPGERRTIMVTSTPNRVFEASSDGIALQIFDTLSGESVDHKIPPIRVAMTAVYNTFQVTPPRGLNFGPVEKGETQTRTFTVRNNGIFPFDWCLFDWADPPTFGEDGRPPPPAASVQAGPFQVKPTSGKLEPDEDIQVEVTFEAVGDEDFDSKLAIWVDGIQGDPPSKVAGQTTASFQGEASTTQTLAGTSAYLLTGQSCVPGINTIDLQTVFEEQFFARTLEDAVLIAGRADVRVFSEADQVFHFGPVPVQNGSAGTASAPTSPAAGGPPPVAYSGVTEYLRLTNPKAIPCKVQLQIKPREGGDASAGSSGVFEVDPQELVIAPHDSRQIEVKFTPTHLANFGAVLEAVVPQGTDPKSNYLSFELRGDGAVPSVSLQGPRLFGDEGGELMMGKLTLGKSHEVRMALRNDGLLPATVRVEYKPSPHFSVACPSSVALSKGEQRSFQVRFHPQQVGPVQTSLNVRTLGNPFEDVAIQLVGEGYSSAICWDLADFRRPGGAFRSSEETSQESAPPAPDELELREVAVGNDLCGNFQLFNGSSKPLRFKFPPDMPAPFGEQIEVEPLEGFVEPGASHPLLLKFKPSEKLTAEKVPIACSIVNVAFSDEGSSELPSGSADGDAAERQYEEVPDTAQELPLHVSAIADIPALEADVEDVNFLPTHMFCSKVFRFLIKNPSEIAVPFEWRVQGKQASAYTVAPMSGTVPAGGEKEVEVHFSPQEVENFDCTLLCSSLIIDSGKPVIRLPLTGSAIRPWCHIELPASDYRSRRQSDVPLDPKYHVVEIVSLGTHVKNTKRFYVCNPTAEPLDFMWQREVPLFSQNRPDTGDEEPFKCLTKKGTILPSKKFEMSFEFSPQSSKTKESFWSFVLLGPKVEEHFLLAGIVEEPRIGMNKPCINFGERLLQGVASETVQLVNKEHIPFSWAIDPASFQEEGELQALSISPVSGVVGPDSSVTITVSFKPLEERPFNFNVACNIKRKKEPVVLNVKGIGYKIHASLAIEEPGGRRVINSGLTESLDMGMLQVHEQREVMMYLKNESKRNFNFRVQMLMGANRRPKPIGAFEKPPYIAISKTQGVAEHHEETAIEFKYAPRDAHMLEGSILQVAIPAGPVEETFSIALTGGAKRSRVEFSFLSHDFGPCFIARGGATMAGEPFSTSEDTRYERVDLIATNRDDSDCLIATNYQREPWLDVQLNAAMIPAGQSMRIPIVFSPREVCEYIQRIEFVVNDYTRMHVDIRGRGCPLKLELTESDMQNVDFGVTKGNEIVMRQVRLVNRSPRPVTFELGDEKGELPERAVSWSPAHPITLRPRQTVDVDLKFMPMYRIAPFRLPLIAKCEHGAEVRLLHVQGTCHATEMRLSEHSVFFGDVVVGSQATRMVRLHNFGDLGAKFRFEIAAKYAKFFSVSPSEGFVRPQEDIALTVAFNPTLDKIQELKRADKSRRGKPAGGDALGLGMGITVRDIRCILDGHAPLQLEASGKCVSQPGETQSLEFSTEVRTKTARNFTINNPTETDWKLQPQVATQDPPGTNFFTCDKEILVPAGKQETVQVYYLPLTMTGEEGTTSPASGKPRVALHRGTVFVGTPDGNAVCYELEGTALPPKAGARLESRVPCKKKHTQVVPIRNWLHERQRFDVSLELVEPEPGSAQAQGINLQGVGTLDLPPGLEREYKFSIYAYHEGSAVVRVSLTSQETGEFMHIEVALEFYAAESLATINLEAACRQPVKHKIAVANPLMQPARFTGTTSEDFFRFSPATLEVPPRSEKTMELIFRPLEHGEGEAEVMLKSDELGTYPYTVSWRATPAGLEKAMVLKAPLGGSVVENFKFMHWAMEPVTYSAKVEAAPGHKGPSIDFLVESSTVSAPACTGGDPQPVELPIRFQPSTLGECRALLVISGAGGGEYKALLTGFAQPPQPQGPITIENGKQGIVEFRNPFDKPTDFSLQVDNPAFMVPTRTQRIDPQKAVQISVNFKSEKVQGGRLIITCDKVSTPWIFFLKGLA